MKKKKGTYIEGTIDEINALFSGKTTQPQPTPGPDDKIKAKMNRRRLWQGQKTKRWFVDWQDDKGQSWTTGSGVGFATKEEALAWNPTTEENGEQKPRPFFDV